MHGESIKEQFFFWSLRPKRICRYTHWNTLWHLKQPEFPLRVEEKTSTGRGWTLYAEHCLCRQRFFLLPVRPVRFLWHLYFLSEISRVSALFFLERWWGIKAAVRNTWRVLQSLLQSRAICHMTSAALFWEICVMTFEEAETKVCWFSPLLGGGGKGLVYSV